jgi:predicted negative regulator of RcsB-dependent stress response
VSFESDEQQAEALKKWWRDNGKQVVVGAIVGLSAVFGWKAWQQYQANINAEAAQALDSMQRQLATGETDRALAQGQQILDTYGKTYYAELASLYLAQAKVTAGQEAEAEASLQRVVNQGRDPALQDLARLRLARLLLGQKRQDEALKYLDQIKNKAYQGRVQHLRGDIALAKGDTQAAAQAYRLALAEKVPEADLVRWKLDDLGLVTKTEAANTQEAN